MMVCRQYQVTFRNLERKNTCSEPAQTAAYKSASWPTVLNHVSNVLVNVDDNAVEGKGYTGRAMLEEEVICETRE